MGICNIVDYDFNIKLIVKNSSEEVVMRQFQRLKLFCFNLTKIFLQWSLLLTLLVRGSNQKFNKVASCGAFTFWQRIIFVYQTLYRNWRTITIHHKFPIGICFKQECFVSRTQTHISTVSIMKYEINKIKKREKNIKKF